MYRSMRVQNQKRRVSVPAGKVVRLKKWPTWHIIGNSPSILEEDLSKLKNTIGLNRILRHKTFIPDYLLLVDEVVLFKERKRIDKYKGKIIRYHRMRGGRPGNFKRGETFDLEVGSHPIRRFDGLFAKSCNTAVYATEWASRRIHPGRGQIVLHGADFTSSKSKVSHFFGNGKKEGCSSNSWHSVLHNLKDTAKFLLEHKIWLINGSPWHGPLDKILPRLIK